LINFRSIAIITIIIRVFQGISQVFQGFFEIFGKIKGWERGKTYDLIDKFWNFEKIVGRGSQVL
jgi:hypothetical protein